MESKVLNEDGQQIIEYPEKIYLEYFSPKDFKFLIKELLKREELTYFDFKDERIKTDDLAKTIGAMANTEGGMITLGVDQKNKENPWKGVSNVDDWTNRLSNLKKDVVSPLINFRWTTFPIEAENLLVIIFIPLVEHSVFIKGRYYYREEASTKYCVNQDLINNKQKNKQKKDLGFIIFEKLRNLIDLYRSESAEKKDNKYYEDIWRGFSSLGLIPPKEIFQEILVNIDQFPYISKDKPFLTSMMHYKSELNFENVKIETVCNILKHKDRFIYLLLQWNKILERIVKTSPETVFLDFVRSESFLEGIFKDKILEEIKSSNYAEIIVLLEIVNSVDKNSSKKLIGHIFESIKVKNDCAVTYIWSLFLKLAILDEILGRYFFKNIQWKNYLLGDIDEQVIILTEIFQKKEEFLNKLEEKEQKEARSFIISLEKELICEFPWNEIVTVDSDYFTLIPLLYQFNQWEDEEIPALSGLPWDTICRRALKQENHRFFLKFIPAVIINSNKFLKVKWLDLLIETKRLDYLIRFLTSIRHKRGGLSVYYRILERLARNPEEIDCILNTSPKREIDTFSQFYISKKTKKWDKILDYLDTQEWGYHGKNLYENYGYMILMHAGLNQTSIEDYFQKYRTNYYHITGSNINLILFSLILGTRNEKKIKNVILKSITEREKEWLYLIDFNNFLKTENQRFEPYLYNNEIIDFKGDFSFCYSHLFCLILLLEILGKFNEQDVNKKQVLQSIFRSIENCFTFILENKNKLPSNEDLKDISRDERVTSFNVNNLASVVINDPSIITSSPSEQEVLNKYWNIFQYGIFLTFEGLKENLQALGSRFLEYYYHYDSEKAESFASKWKNEKPLLRLYYTANGSLIRKFLLNQVLTFIEARMNGEDLEVSSLFHLAFPEASEKILVIKNLGDLLNSDFHSINLTSLKLTHRDLFFSEDWMSNIDWKRIFRTDYSLNELKSFFGDYYWRDIPENVLNTVFDDHSVEILFKICLKEKNPLIAIENLFFLFERRSQVNDDLNQVFKRIINLPAFQKHDFIEDLLKLEIQKALHILQLIHTKWDEKIGTTILNDSRFINALKLKIHSEEIDDLLDTWYFIFERMEDKSIDFMIQLKEKLFPINWKGTIDKLVDKYVKISDIEDILRDISTLKQVLVDELPNLLKKAPSNQYSFDYICYNITILSLLDGSVAEQVITSLTWDEHFDTKYSYNLNNGFEIIAEYWGKNLTSALIQSKGFSLILIHDRKYRIIPHDTYELLGKSRNKSDVFWQKKIDLIVNIPSFWEIDWIEQLNNLLFYDLGPLYVKHFFMLIEIFTKHSENLEVQRMFNTQRFIDIPWDLVFEIHESSEVKLFISIIIEKIRGVSQNTADEILKIYFS